MVYLCVAITAVHGVSVWSCTAVHGVSVLPLLQCMVNLCGHYCSAWCICVATTAVHGISMWSLLQCMVYLCGISEVITAVHGYICGSAWCICVAITAVHGVSMWSILQCMVYLCGHYCSE